MSTEWELARLGEESTVYPLEHMEQVRAGSAALASQAQRSLAVMSRDLEARIYDQEPFLEAVKGLALSSRNARIRFLIHDSRYAVRHGHRLIELACGLSTFIAIRPLPEEGAALTEAFLVADERGVLHRPQGDRYQGTLSFNDPLQARDLLRCFDALWERSEPDSELRRLHL